MATRKIGTIQRQRKRPSRAIIAGEPATAPIQVKRTGDLCARVASILDQARTNVVRAVDSNMVIAYWLIGREIVQEIQGGEDRAAGLSGRRARHS